MFKKAWNWLSGKKNKIGNAVLFIAGAAETASSLGLFPVHTAAYKIGIGAGVLIKGVGLWHKFKKGELSLEDIKGLRKSLQSTGKAK
jgi:hypothetical protein